MQREKKAENDLEVKLFSNLMQWVFIMFYSPSEFIIV